MGIMQRRINIKALLTLFFMLMPGYSTLNAQASDVTPQLVNSTARTKTSFPRGLRPIEDRITTISIHSLEDSNSHARQIVQKSEEALGKWSTTITVNAQGHELWEGQGQNPNDPVLDSRLELQWKIDLKAKNLFYKRESYTGPNLAWCFQQSVRPNAQYSELCHSGALHDDSSIPLAAEWGYAIRDFPGPNALLEQALEHMNSLQFEGESFYASEPQLVVSYSPGSGGKTLLYINERNYLLTKAEFPATNAPFHPGFVPYISFSDYRLRLGQRFPSKVVASRQLYGLEVVTDVLRISQVTFDQRLSQSDYAPTSDAVAWREPETQSVRKVTENLYFVENAAPDYNCMFFVADDFVVVIESPVSDAVSSAVIKAIRGITDKPIRYLVPTHFHYDHVGGVARYLQDGVTLLTTLGNRSYFETIRKTGVWPDATLAKNARIETFDREFEFKHGAQIFRLYAVTNPHVDEMIIGYLPAERILYVADPFTNDWGRLRRSTPEERSMIKTLAQLDIQPKTILSGHGPITSFENVNGLF